MDGLPPAFRKWSIAAFVLESIVVVFAFLFMVLFLRWAIDGIMLCVLLVVMAVSAVFLLVTGRAPAGK